MIRARFRARRETKWPAAASFSRHWGNSLAGNRGRFAAFVGPELDAVEAGVQPAGLQEFRVRPALDDAPLVEDEDAISVANRGQTMRDGDRGAAGRQRRQAFED